MKITREHVIGRKFEDDFPPPPPGHRKPFVLHDVHRGRVRHADDFDLVVRGPCVDCNSGWMDQLDEAVRPVIKPMIWGKSTVVSVADQELISRWAVKVSMVADFTHRSQRVMRPRDLESFWESQSPTAHTGVWLAKHLECDPFVNLLARRMRYRPQGARLTDLLQAHLVTLRLCHLVVQVAVPWVRVPFPRGTDNERFVVRIWPAKEARSWPPAMTLRDQAELKDFSTAFHHGDFVVVEEAE